MEPPPQTFWTRRAVMKAGAAALLAPRVPSHPIIDSHVHVWKPSAGFPYATGADVPINLDASAEQLLAKMQANNVARTVLIQVIHYKFDNRYLVDTLHRYPNRFAGVCRVDPEDPAAPGHLSHWTEAGCHGVRLSPADDARGDWIRGPLMHPLWKRCQQLRVPMTLLLSTARLPDVLPLLERFPELTVVIDHMADCPVDDPTRLRLLTALARYPRVFVKISHMWSLSKQPYPYPDATSLVARVRDAFSSNRLMSGTDWPIKTELLDYPGRIDLYRNHLPIFNAAEREDILYRTVQRVWPFGL